MGAAVGIDLGTTNSVVAIYKNGKCKVIGDGAGSTIPSIVAVDAKGRKMIGQQAKRQTLINPTDTVYGAKRFIGREFGSGTVSDAASKFSYQVKEGRSKDVLVHMAGEDYSLEEISALILDHVRNVAQDSLEEEITDAVITVPAYFNESQRQSVKSAGKIAGLNVLRIINEPTAAAIAYGFGKHYNKKIVVYDLGGGTFDVSVLHLRNNVYEVLATGGDTWLGGIDFDNRLIEMLVGQFKQETGIDATADPVMLQRIKDAAERAKIDLSSRELVRSQIPYLALKDGEPVSLSYQITREEFNALCGDLVDRTLQICKQVLTEKSLTPADIEEVLLVGGQTRMPIITEKATAFFGKPPSKGAHPDEAVAMGAALMAHVLSGGEQVSKEILLLDTLPMSIGYAGPDGGFTRVFERHSPIPNEKAVVLRNNKPGQLVLEIYQGEEKKAKANQYLGRVQFDLATPAPSGQAEVESVFRMDSEGLLHVEMTDVANKTSTVHHVKVSSAGSERLHKDLIPARPATARPGGTAPPRIQNVTETTKIQIQKPAAPKPASPILPVAAAEKVLDNDEFFGVAAQLKKRQEAKSGPAPQPMEAPSKAAPAASKGPAGAQNQAVKSDTAKAKAGAAKPPAKRPDVVVMDSSKSEGFLGKILSKFRKK